MNLDKLEEQLFEILCDHGAKLYGIGDMSDVSNNGLNRGIAVAVPVPAKIVRDLQSAPTLEYMEAYRSLNERLNEIVSAGADFLKKEGYRAIANTTEAVKQDEDWCSPIPHKTFATRAGLGWIGKSCLLVTKEYGSSIRLSSILTDAPLSPGIPVRKSRCGACRICADKCPARALRGVNWVEGMDREALFEKELCKDIQLKRMEEATGIRTDLCGLCFAVCPYTTARLKKEL